MGSPTNPGDSDKVIETDEEGYLLNPDDWSEKVAEEMAFQQS